MICLGEHIEITGSFDTEKGSNLMVVFEKCDLGPSLCKNDADIDEWLKQKYIVVLENNKVFS